MKKQASKFEVEWPEPEGAVDFMARMKEEDTINESLGEAYVLLQRFSIRLCESMIEFGPMMTDEQTAKEPGSIGWNLRQNDEIQNEYEAFRKRYMKEATKCK